jgi:bacteriocin-like protein
MTRRRSKLVLKKETLVELTKTELAQVAGGNATGQVRTLGLDTSCWTNNTTQNFLCQ